MAVDERKQIADRAMKGSIIDSIGMSLERFKGSLSDDRKVRLFTMSNADLKKLAVDVGGTQKGMKAISLIVAAIAASEQQQKRS